MEKSKRRGYSNESSNSISVEWYTPKWVFDEIGVQFDIDVCAPKGGLDWIPCVKSFDKEVDGLSQEWNGLVWCNPPYGRNCIPFLQKLDEHRNGIALLPARTDTKWFHNYVVKADIILFLNGRINFVDGNGLTGNGGAGTGSMLIGWGSEATVALTMMKDKGLLVKL